MLCYDFVNMSQMSDSPLLDALTNIKALIGYEELSLLPLNTHIPLLFTLRTLVHLQLPLRCSLPIAKTSLFSARLYSYLLLKTKPLTI
jgi:hypothetical protein